MRKMILGNKLMRQDYDRPPSYSKHVENRTSNIIAFQMF